MLDLISLSYAADQSFSSTFGTLQAGAVGWQMTSTFGVGITEDPPSKGESKKLSYQEAGEVKAEITISGNPPTAEISTKIQNPLYLLDANSKASITGSLCPDTNGKVTLRLTQSSQGKAGNNGKMKYGRTIDVTVTAAVGDDGGTLSDDVRSKQPDEDPIGSQTLGTTALAAAQKYWRNGHCVTINASSPGTVKPKATSKLPVTVIHKRDGTSVSAKVTAALTGGESFTPTVIPKTPGEIAHTAVSKDGATMTITLTATSRRGNATTDLTINTKGMFFKLDGGADEFHGTGIVRDFEKPFFISDGETGRGTTTEERGHGKGQRRNGQAPDRRPAQSPRHAAERKVMFGTESCPRPSGGAHSSRRNSAGVSATTGHSSFTQLGLGRAARSVVVRTGAHW
jgi:hypothetical protein